MLTIQILNDGTGTNESANYEYRVHVNGDLVRLGLIKGHNRDDGWAALLELIAAKERTDSQSGETSPLLNNPTL
jgi:hypothetical protein